MPPPVTALHLWTITELIQTLLSIGLELARRFRISLPPVPPQDDTIPFHCTETCQWCTCTCVRTAPVHRTHQCHRHLGFWLVSFLRGYNTQTSTNGCGWRWFQRPLAASISVQTAWSWRQSMWGLTAGSFWVAAWWIFRCGWWFFSSCAWFCRFWCWRQSWLAFWPWTELGTELNFVGGFPTTLPGAQTKVQTSEHCEGSHTQPWSEAHCRWVCIHEGTWTFFWDEATMAKGSTISLICKAEVVLGNLQLPVCFQSSACLTMLLQVIQQQRFHALSSNWKPQSSASGWPGSFRVMMIFAGYPYPGSKPWCYWRLMQPDLGSHYWLLVPCAQTRNWDRFSMMFLHQSLLVQFSSVAIPCGGFHVGCRPSFWGPRSTRARELCTPTFATSALQRLGQQRQHNLLKHCAFQMPCLAFARPALMICSVHVLWVPHTPYIWQRGCAGRQRCSRFLRFNSWKPFVCRMSRCITVSLLVIFSFAWWQLLGGMIQCMLSPWNFRRQTTFACWRRQHQSTSRPVPRNSRGSCCHLLHRDKPWLLKTGQTHGWVQERIHAVLDGAIFCALGPNIKAIGQTQRCQPLRPLFG